MAGKTHLGAFEQLVLLAILQLGEEAFGPSIGRELERRAGRKVSRGALYATLDRLEGKGLLGWKAEPGSPRRGGQRRRRFRVTAAGLRELAASRETLLGLWSGLEQLLVKALR